MIAPDRSIFMVMCDFGSAFEAVVHPEDTRETVVSDMVAGQYEAPAYIVESNAVDRWSRDVSADIADDVVTRAIEQGATLSEGTFAFCQTHHAAPLWAHGLHGGRYIREAA